MQKEFGQFLDLIIMGFYLTANNKFCRCDSLDCTMDILDLSIPQRVSHFGCYTILQAWHAQSMQKTWPKKRCLYILFTGFKIRVHGFPTNATIKYSSQCSLPSPAYWRAFQAAKAFLGACGVKCPCGGPYGVFSRKVTPSGVVKSLEMEFLLMCPLIGLENKLSSRMRRWNSSWGRISAQGGPDFTWIYCLIL